MIYNSALYSLLSKVPSCLLDSYWITRTIFFFCHFRYIFGENNSEKWVIIAYFNRALAVSTRSTQFGITKYSVPCRKNPTGISQHVVGPMYGKWSHISKVYRYEYYGQIQWIPLNRDSDKGDFRLLGFFQGNRFFM